MNMAGNFLPGIYFEIMQPICGHRKVLPLSGTSLSRQRPLRTKNMLSVNKIYNSYNKDRDHNCVKYDSGDTQTLSLYSVTLIDFLLVPVSGGTSDPKPPITKILSFPLPFPTSVLTTSILSPFSAGCFMSCFSAVHFCTRGIQTRNKPPTAWINPNVNIVSSGRPVESIRYPEIQNQPGVIYLKLYMAICNLSKVDDEHLALLSF